MNALLSTLLALAVTLGPLPPLRAAEPEAAVSASDLAAKLSEKQQDGASYVRLKMETTGARKSALQVQIKSRASRGGTELVYQILWPKERKGEGVLLRRSGGRGATVVVFTPPDKTQTLESGQLREGLFGSDLAYEDVIENFFAWDQQALVGTETVDRVNCQILESKPGKSRSSYTSVRTWVDTRRLVPMRVEKYGAGGKLIRRIDTTRVVNDDKGRPIPANLTVHGPGDSVTELDGSKIRHGVSYSDADFSPEGLKETSVPKGSPE